MDKITAFIQIILYLIGFLMLGGGLGYAAAKGAFNFNDDDDDDDSGSRPDPIDPGRTDRLGDVSKGIQRSIDHIETGNEYAESGIAKIRAGLEELRYQDTKTRKRDKTPKND